MMRKGFFKRMLALLTAVGLMTALLPGALALSGDWAELQLSLTWTDGAGNPQTAVAMPVAEGAFWAYVPGDALGSLTLSAMHPNHDYTFMPASGEVLMAVMDAGETLDGPYTEILATDASGMTELFRLYIKINTLIRVQLLFMNIFLKDCLYLMILAIL